MKWNARVNADIEALIEAKKELEKELAGAKKPRHGDYRDGRIYLEFPERITDRAGFAYVNCNCVQGLLNVEDRFNDLSGPTVNIFDLIAEHEAVQEPLALERFETNERVVFLNGNSNMVIRQGNNWLEILNKDIDDFILNARRVRATQLRKNADSLHRGADKV